VGAYARCFEGLTAQEADKLADSFELTACVRCERLAALLAPPAPDSSEAELEPTP
jgi:hypothetical protein